MSDSPKHSSDLLHFPGRKQTIARMLVDDQPEEKHDQSQQDMPRQKPSIGKFEPPSDILARVQAFLPQLQTANDQLAQKDASELDIENVNEQEDDQYIEMNLGLGVFEAKRKDADASDSSDPNDSSDNEDIIIPSSSSKPTTTEKPNIQLLHSDDNKHP